MSTQDQILTLRGCLASQLSADNAIRKDAEAQVKKISKQDPGQFIQTLTHIVLQDASGDPAEAKGHAATRQLASIVFKNALFARVFSGGRTDVAVSLWYKLDAGIRANIRAAFLQKLGGAGPAQVDLAYMKDLCLCLSTIAALEIPAGHWADFVSVMAEQGNQNESEFFKLAGIYNLGLIQETLQPSDFKTDDLNRIWETMLQNINPANLQLTRLVAAAIGRLAPSTQANFQQQGQSELIMTGIFSLLAIGDSEISKKTLEGLIEIVKLNYQHMGPYLERFLALTGALMGAADLADPEQAEPARQAIEIWNTLCEEELELRKDPNAQQLQLVGQSKWQELATILFNGLQHAGFDEEDQSLDEEGEQSIGLSCAAALSFLTEVVGDPMLDVAFLYVQGQLSGPAVTSLVHYNCLMAFNSTVEGPTAAKLLANYGQVFEWVMQNTGHASVRVQCATSCLLAHLAKHCPDLFQTEGNLGSFYAWFTQAAQSAEHPKLTTFAIQAMQNLFVSFASRGCSAILNNQFTDIIRLCVDKVLDRAFIAGGFIVGLADSVNDICQHCDAVGLQQELAALCAQVFGTIDQIVGAGTAYTEQEIELLVNHFGGLLQVTVVRVGPQGMTAELSAGVFATLQAIVKYDPCRQGSLLILNGMLNALDSAAVGEVAEPILAIITGTLEDATSAFDTACKRLAVGLLQDLATSMGAGFSQMLEHVTGMIFKVLGDASLPTDVKTTAIMAIGDICLMTEKAFQPYFERTMDVLIQAGIASCAEIDPSLPAEDAAHVHELRHALIDAFMSIVNGIKSPDDQGDLAAGAGQSGAADDQLVGSIRNMFFYIERLVTLRDLRVDPELAKQILELYCDIVVLQTQGRSQSRAALEFQGQIRASSLHKSMEARFGAHAAAIQALDAGDSIRRFQEVVAGHVEVAGV